MLALGPEKQHDSVELLEAAHALMSWRVNSMRTCQCVRCLPPASQTPPAVSPRPHLLFLLPLPTPPPPAPPALPPSREDRALLSQRSLAEQLEGLDLWHKALLLGLNRFSTQFRSAGCDVLAAADREGFQMGAEGAHYEGPLRLQVWACFGVGWEGGGVTGGLQPLLPLLHVRPPTQDPHMW